MSMEMTLLLGLAIGVVAFIALWVFLPKDTPSLIAPKPSTPKVGLKFAKPVVIVPATMMIETVPDNKPPMFQNLPHIVEAAALDMAANPSQSHSF